MLSEQLTGLRIREEHVISAIRAIGLNAEKPSSWNDNEMLKLAEFIRKISKPMIIAFNKCDKASEMLMQKMQEIADEYIVIPTSAESELALTNAAEKGFLDYIPGSKTFELQKPDELSDEQKKALDYIKSHVLKKYGSTGIQKCIEAAGTLLDLIVVYPVEDENHLTDKEGRILPDVHLISRGSTAKDLAYKVHTDLGDHFIRAIDARTKRVIGADHVLNDGDIISIVADA